MVVLGQHVPMAKDEALVSRSKGATKFGIASTRAVMLTCFKFVKPMCACSFHCNFVYLPLRRLVSGAIMGVQHGEVERRGLTENGINLVSDRLDLRIREG